MSEQTTTKPKGLSSHPQGQMGALPSSTHRQTLWMSGDEVAAANAKSSTARAVGAARVPRAYIVDMSNMAEVPNTRQEQFNKDTGTLTATITWKCWANNATEIATKAALLLGTWHPYLPAFQCVNTTITYDINQEGPNNTGWLYPYTCAKIKCDFQVRELPDRNYTLDMNYDIHTADWVFDFPVFFGYSKFGGVDPTSPLLPFVKNRRHTRHTMVLRRTYSGLPALPAWLMALNGKVNDDVVLDLDLGVTFAPGSLLLVAGQTQRTISVQNLTIQQPVITWNFTYEVHFDSVGWNRTVRGMNNEVNLWYKSPAGFLPFLYYPQVPFGNLTIPFI